MGINKMNDNDLAKFGHAFIQHIRDLAIVETQIRIRQIVEGHKSGHKYKNVIDKISESDIPVLQDLLKGVVDSTLHSVLLFFEQAEDAKIMIETKEGPVNLKELVSGDLQGYIFEWAEKYGKYPIDI